MTGAAALGAALSYAIFSRTLRNPVVDSLPPDDAALAERVRAALGRIVADPRAIDVRVREGQVTLKGPVTPDEAEELVACAARVPGVLGVDDRMSVNPNT